MAEERRFVFDTNVIVSALLIKRSVARLVLGFHKPASRDELHER
jgi:predicted nucleic acid-binding protein